MPLRPSEPDIFSPKSAPSSRAMRAGGERGGIGVDSVPHAEEMPAPARGSAATATATKVRGAAPKSPPAPPLRSLARMDTAAGSDGLGTAEKSPGRPLRRPLRSIRHARPALSDRKERYIFGKSSPERARPRNATGRPWQCGLCPPALSRDDHCRMPLAWPSRQRQTLFVSVLTGGPDPRAPP